MRIIYVVPGPMDGAEMERRVGLLRDWASPGTEVDITCVSEGPASIESMYEEYLSIPATMKLMYEVQSQGYDAAILGCAGDPGLDAAREITDDMVVIGPGQTSMQIATMLGHRFSVLTIEDSLIPSSYELAYKAGVLEKLASVVPVNVPVLELATDKDASLEKIIAVGRTAVTEDRADVLVMGCMSMGFLNVAKEIERAVGVPVVNPSMTGLKAAEAIVGSGLMHSKRAFATPPKLKSGRVDDLDDLYIGAS
jgi:allantoin racemase